MNQSLLLLLPCLLIVVVVPCAHSYKNGPPVVANPEVCIDMFPSGHNSLEQATPSPHRIVYNTNNCYSNAQQPITISVYHTEEGNYWTGIFIQARIVDGGNESFGVFSTDDPYLAPFSCPPSINNTLGQTTNFHFMNRNFTWIPTAGLTGDIEFVATMVRSRTRFWMYDKSSILHYSPTCATVDITPPVLLPSTTVSTAPPPSTTTAGTGTTPSATTGTTSNMTTTTDMYTSGSSPSTNAALPLYLTLVATSSFIVKMIHSSQSL